MTADQLRAGRALLKWTVRDMAEKAGVTPNTVSRIENGGDAKASTLTEMRAALETAGIEFIAENGGGAGVRFRERAGR